AYRTSLAALESLVRQFGNNPEYHSDLSAVLDDLGRLLHDRAYPNDPKLVARLVWPSVSGFVLADFGVLAQIHFTHPALRDAEDCLKKAIEHHQKSAKHQQDRFRSLSRGRGKIQTPSPQQALARIFFFLADTRILLGEHAGAAEAARLM